MRSEGAALVDPADDDYRLKAGSPAIGTGLGLPAGETDFAGALFEDPPARGALELSAWQAWRADQFPMPAQLADPAISGPHATPANDGIPNFVKFVFLLDPFQDESARGQGRGCRERGLWTGGGVVTAEHYGW